MYISKWIKRAAIILMTFSIIASVMGCTAFRTAEQPVEAQADTEIPIPPEVSDNDTAKEAPQKIVTNLIGEQKMRDSIKINTQDTLLLPMLTQIPAPSSANSPSESELALRNEWISELKDGTRSVVAFSLGDEPQDLRLWERTVTEQEDGNNLIVYSKDGLEVRLMIAAPSDSAALEWQVRLVNTAAENTPVLSDIKLMDFYFSSEESKITWSNGSNFDETDFELTTEALVDGKLRKLSSDGGRSSSGMMPYWRLTCGEISYMGAIGWTGQWQTTFLQDGGQVHLQAGMSHGNFYVMPDEVLDLPSMALIPVTDGNEFNKLRRWIQMYHTPQYNGKLALGPISQGMWGATDEEEHLSTIEDLAEADIGYEAYWIDAGWYGKSDAMLSESQYDDVWFRNAGSWMPQETLYPDGLASIGDAAEKNGLRLLLWFEPERANIHSILAEEHPEWLLDASSDKENLLVDFGNPEARAYMTDLICDRIQEYGVRIYRQDFNISPLEYWVKNDDSDRRGITEIKYINGLYQFWTELLERNPGLVIDNCAGGGRRMDFAALSLSTVMSKSDYQCNADTATSEGCQTLMHGLNHWIGPTGIFAMRRLQKYEVRCNYGYSLQMQLDMGPVEMQKDVIAEMKRCRPLFYGDYYSLLRGDAENPGWTVMQFDRQDLGQGVIFAFCTGEDSEACVCVQGLDDTAMYQLECADDGTNVLVSGATLHQGLTIHVNSPQQSRLYFYTCAEAEFNINY